MNMKKGNALVEFVIILPILIFIFIALVDFYRVSSIKNNIESRMNDAINMYEDKKTIEEIENYINSNNKYTLSLFITNTNNEYYTFTINTKIKLVTPGASLIFENPYKVEINRTLYEKK